MTVALLLSGCAGSPSADRGAHAMVSVPREGNSWIGSIVPRLHRAGLRIAIPAPWGASSFGSVSAMIDHPAPLTRVPAGTSVTLDIEYLVGLPGKESGRFVVPAVTGDRLSQATALLDAAHLAWGVRAAPLPPTATADLLSVYCVDRQDPAGGTPVTIPPSSRRLRLVELDARPC